MWRAGLRRRGDLLVGRVRPSCSSRASLRRSRGPRADRRSAAPRPTRVGPIVFLDRGRAARARAGRATSSGSTRIAPHALVALGQGAELDAAVARCLELLAADPELQVAALRVEPLARSSRVPDGVVHLRGDLPDEPLLPRLRPRRLRRRLQRLPRADRPPASRRSSSRCRARSTTRPRGRAGRRRAGWGGGSTAPEDAALERAAGRAARCRCRAQAVRRASRPCHLLGRAAGAAAWSSRACRGEGQALLGR